MTFSYTINNAPIRWLMLGEEFDINNLDLCGQTLEDESALERPLGFLKFFSDVDECVDYITDVQDSFIILTIRGQFAWRVIPYIHDFILLAAVYIICEPKNEKRNKEWSAKYIKVKAVISQIEDYNTMIYRNHFKSTASNKTDDSHSRFYAMIPYNIFDSAENTYKDLSNENGNFLWMELLTEVLLHMYSSKNIMDEFLKMCHTFNAKEYNEERIFIFAGIYDSLNPVKWYTKEPFVYRFLNKICRSGDIDKLILLRILVRDMNNQLKEEQKKFVEPYIKVYRGQAMTLTELQYLQKHIGNLISMNSFLSTSKYRQTAVAYAESIDKSDSSLRSVLFEIDCDTHRSDTKPFADISHLSCFQDEDEVLFMLGSVFRVQSVQQNETNDLWIIKMTLCGKNDYDFENVLRSIRGNLAENPSLTTLGLLFQRMGDFKRAAECFQQHLNLLEDDDGTIRSGCYHNLGNIAREIGDNDQALYYLNQALEIRLNLSSIEKSVMADMYNDIGNVHNETKNYKLSYEYYKNGLLLARESIGENHRLSAMIYGNIGENCRNQEQYDLALENLSKCLNILRNLEFEEQPLIAQTLSSIGQTYSLKGDLEIALSYMKEALNIQRKTLPKNHVSLGISLNNIGSTYAQTENFDLALENFKKAEKIFQIALPRDHSSTRGVTQNIETLMSVLNLRSTH